MAKQSDHTCSFCDKPLPETPVTAENFYGIPVEVCSEECKEALEKQCEGEWQQMEDAGY